MIGSKTRLLPPSSIIVVSKFTLLILHLRVGSSLSSLFDSSMHFVFVRFFYRLMSSLIFIDVLLQNLLSRFQPRVQSSPACVGLHRDVITHTYSLYAIGLLFPCRQENCQALPILSISYLVSVQTSSFGRYPIH